MSQAPTLDVVRRAVRCVVEQTPELRDRPELRQRLAANMVGVSQAAAELLEAEQQFDQQIAKRKKPALSQAQAAGDIHRRTAVNSAAGVLQATRQAIDFPGFVTSLISGVFQAMTTSTIQQLEAYANLLTAINTSTSAFAAGNITPGRAATWAASQFAQFQITGDPPQLALKDDAEMPTAQELRSALEASAEEVSEIAEDNLEETLLPLVSRKLARERQSMLATMVLMGMNRIVVDDGRIHASMELQVDARSTAEQTQADRFDSRFSTSASGSFGTGMWGASASMSASVGYVRSDEQFTREDIALRAGLRSSVDIGFHTEPIQLDRMARSGTVSRVRERALVPEAERAAAEAPRASLLTPDERRTARPTFEAIPNLPTAPDPNSQEQRDLRARRDFSAAPAETAAPTDSTTTTTTDTAAAPTDTAAAPTDTAAAPADTAAAPTG